MFAVLIWVWFVHCGWVVVCVLIWMVEFCVCFVAGGYLCLRCADAVAGGSLDCDNCV